MIEMTRAGMRMANIKKKGKPKKNIKKPEGMFLRHEKSGTKYTKNSE